MDGQRQDVISNIAHNADRLLEEFLGDLQILGAKLSGTDFGQNKIMIYGQQLTQQELDSVASFSVEDLTVQNVQDAVFALFTIRDNLVNALSALSQIQKVK